MTSTRRLPELVRLFVKLGVLGFGGPAAHIAMMEDEVVRKRGWLSRERYLDLVGATNLIPGPNSTEMAIHVGFIRAGWRGLAVAGASFILPAVLITLAFAWAYVRFGSVPQVEPLLFGIKPAVIAVILIAVWRLGRSAVRGWRLALVGLGVGVATYLGSDEVLALLGGGLIGMLWLRLSSGSSGAGGTGVAGVVPAQLAPIALAGVGSARTGGTGAAGMLAGGLAALGAVPLWKLTLFFLKVGAVLYGSGYVLVAFLEGGLVHDYGWLTRAELLDAIAIGQFTPGPVLSAATFVGYLVAGLPGAGLATLGIFLPSFFFVAGLNPLIPRLRASPWTAAFLDAVNVSAVALMAVVTLELGRSTLTDWPAWVIAVGAATAGLVWRVSSVWLVLGGAVLGWLLGT